MIKFGNVKLHMAWYDHRLTSSKVLVIDSYFKAKEEKVKTRGIENTISFILPYTQESCLSLY